MRGLAEVSSRSAELRIKARAAKESLDAARTYLGVTEEATGHLDTSTTASLTFRLQMLRERALAHKTVVAQEAEIEEAAVQLASLEKFGAQIRQHLDGLERNFAGGRLYAPIDGIVSTRPAKDGMSVVAGTPLVEIRDPSDIFVYWSIPNARLRDPAIGDKVIVLFGNWRIPGTITELLPISETFNTSQAIMGREPIATQTARVDFSSKEAAPALNTTVSVHMYYTNFAARAAEVLARVFGFHRG
jgi:multidrug resistance efflux pump